MQTKQSRVQEHAAASDYLCLGEVSCPVGRFRDDLVTVLIDDLSRLLCCDQANRHSMLFKKGDDIPDAPDRFLGFGTEPTDGISGPFARPKAFFFRRNR